MGGEVMDEKCRHFRELIRRVASEHQQNKEKDSLLDTIAKIILLDQMTRNAFRCEEEAYAYDDLVVDILDNLFQEKDGATETISEETLTNFVNNPEVTFADSMFVAIACQHQEKPVFHGVDGRIFELQRLRFPEQDGILKLAFIQSNSHYEVLKRFGRYPHRNHRLGRESTAEETEWLSDYENMPHWARSQLKPPEEKKETTFPTLEQD